MILITGANGQLGTDFIKFFKKSNIDFLATDINELDITNNEDVETFFNDNRNITLIINCAAYNNVDKAEKESELAFALNSEAPKKLALIAKKKGIDFVTYSTDFVFDGKKNDEYIESDKTNPLNVYAESKLKGEKEVLNTYENVFVIRTSWVFGLGNNNFCKSIINWSKKNDVLKIVDDQISVPTYSFDLASYSLDLIKSKKYGLYHLVNSGICSKFEQAEYILEKINWQGKLVKAKTEDFNLPAKRSKFTKLNCDKVESVIKRKMPNWKDGIDRFLEELKQDN